MKKILGYVAGVAAILALGGCASTSAQGSKSSVKTLSTTKQMKLRTPYKKNARQLDFTNGRKSAKLTVLNGKKQCVKKSNVAKKGNFTLKLTKAQAKKLSQCSTFKYSVAQKGYKTYTVTNPVTK
ncbi:hypothetical protein [Levilactobacillus acidifarinae]|uniref:Lipoprotein n=1 Tax=Levilactobacillus acidifarinae DSM 19394 = JCM 15949 TaxID=1423715 RepID=A0A0R1LH23_9LACO|nr:hypothetical protein [Levilactobacillus acidifarinae]KRK94981.1 hypothetical protein FD25_GL002166 [Levilactobacillus acidifarinae DSM 19394]GEO70090.1 hypothetical protein LAC03_20000 [Levilactobacillus acidifarinae]